MDALQKPAQKELVMIEFRYNRTDNEGERHYTTKTATIGVFDTLNEANEAGNKVLDILEKRFKPGWSRDRFGAKLLGYPVRLISNLGYLKTPFDFYIKIEPLVFHDVNATIDEILTA